jgi:histidinol dehydrogenase
MMALRTSIGALDAGDLDRLLARGRSTDPDVARSVSATIADVRARGDDALRDAVRRFDGVQHPVLEVPAAELRAAVEGLDPDFRAALETAAAAIAAFHKAQLPEPLEVQAGPGLRLGHRPDPLRRVGVYAPGGRASYPSSVLMGVVPARVAGVGEVVVCSPPGGDGRPAAGVLAAAAIAGADRVFAVGGAAAIAGLAYGTATLPAVDRVVGPGNAYVTEAKRQLTGVVGIDSPAGPSELLVIADDGAAPERIARELLAQAEHDPDAAVVLVAIDAGVAAAAERALARLVADSPRRDIVRAALAASGAVLAAASLEEAVSFAERYAPEHLLLLVRQPQDALARVRCAGTVFLGDGASVAFGDYTTGANHVLPTAGHARAYSGLSVDDFFRWTTWQEIGPDAAARLADATATLAEREGLPGHAAAARGAAQREADGTAAAAGSAKAGAEEAAMPAAAEVPATEMAAPAPATPAASTPPQARPGIRTLALYDPRRGSVPVDVSDNTNLFGAAPSAVAALTGPPAALVSRYPSPYADRLKRAAAERFGVAPENVTTGCGSDDLIDSAVRAFCPPDTVLAFQSPTFPMAALFAGMNDARPVGVAPGPDFGLDADALLAADARVLYVCRPNNPSGNLFDASAVRRLMAEAPGLVLLDEAYAEFAGESLIPEAVSSRGTVVLRTLSKAYGLAGLRVGLAVGPAPVIAEIEKSRGPFKIGALAEEAAVAALSRDADWVAETVERTARQRDWLAVRIEELGLRVWPSRTNFLLVGLGGRRADDVAAGLRARGLGVRAFPGLPLAGDAIRVTVGPDDAMDALVRALTETLA